MLFRVLYALTRAKSTCSRSRDGAHINRHKNQDQEQSGNFYGCSTVVLIGITCPAITVVTVILTGTRTKARSRAVTSTVVLRLFL